MDFLHRALLLCCVTLAISTGKSMQLHYNTNCKHLVKIPSTDIEQFLEQSWTLSYRRGVGRRDRVQIVFVKILTVYGV